MPGRASGSTTWRKACHRLAPSISAASSSSAGRPSKKLIITQTTIGTVITRWMMISGYSVPVSPSARNRMNSGIEIAQAGRHARQEHEQAAGPEARALAMP